VAKASSFGAEDAVIVDMMIKINPRFRFFTLDTGRLPQETYDVMDAVRKRYGINLEVMFPDTDEVEEMVRKKGLNLFYESVENRRLCCGIRKVHPTNRMLGTLDGWITGLRQDQTETRRDAKIFEVDTQHNNILKINPLVDWTWDRLWEYIRANDVPYNKLLDAGYSSIGCAPCTRAVEAGQDARSGRWWWEHDTHKECGLHVDYKK
jgi:phosphoadenosine phosphosulfate reductase